MSAFGRWTFLRKPGLFAGLLSLLLLLPIAGVSAREYSYDRIDTVFSLHEDASVTVEERQVFRFEGEYHSGWRNIPKRGFSGFRVLGVTDATTGTEYAYSSRRLDKADPSSWGRYTDFTENGEEIIEWYYDARDETREFVLSYAMDGVVSFYDDHDEFYWNVLTEYAVPIGTVGVTVVLPAKTDADRITSVSYVSPAGIGRSSEIPDGRTVRYAFSDVPSGGDVTIAPGWPKGIVSEELYRRNFLFSNLGYILSALIVFLVPIILVLRWYFTERHGTGRGTIVPQYEPPKGLRPAMAEIVMNERLSNRTWPATIVDLAVRGYLDIEEVPPSRLAKDAARALLVVALVGLGMAAFFAIGPWALVLFVPAALFRTLSTRPLVLVPSEYVIRRKESADRNGLEDYEAVFLAALFDGREEFSTKAMRKDVTAAQSLARKLRKLQEGIAHETVGDTGAYERDFRGWKVGRGVLIASAAILFILFVVASFPQWPVFCLVLAYGVATVFLFVRYNPRLNREGQILREDWLGFRMYLSTAEKFRLRNLTPETFERLLPYAIIFGVEKKWARAFEGMEMVSPEWYSGSSVSSVASGGSAVGFSPAAFSTSFASSFASAFSSSSGGGASGGGGSAGGGGGGGGGGAG